MTSAAKLWPWWRRVVTGLCALALALSSYLSWHQFAGGAVIGCDGGGECDRVLSSRWSSIGGVLPVSGIAAGAYLALLVASFSLGTDTPTPVRRFAWRAMLILTGAAAGAAVWFIAVQKWIVGAYCVYCMVTHLTGLALAAIVFRRAPRQSDDDSVANSASIVHVRAATGYGILGLALAAILALAQASITPKALSREGESQKNLSSVDRHTAPFVGSPDARYVVTLLFDYQCPHCQQLHFMLEEAIRRYHGQLAFALCPAPLCKECNPYIEREVDAFKDSCELARVALAVWRAKREVFAEFEHWLFTHESGDFWRPRHLDAARAKAIDVVGRANFEAARADPWVERYLQSSVRIYGESLENGNAVPKLVFASRWVIPAPQNADDLVSILQENLKLPKP